MLAGFLLEEVGSLEIVATCEDSAVRTFDGLEELIEYENASDRQIIELKLTSHSSYSAEQERIYVNLEFSSGKTGPWLFDSCYIHIYVSGPDEKSLYIRNEIEHKVKGLQPWYSRFARLQGYHIGFFLSVLVGISITLVVRLKIPDTNLPFPGESINSESILSWMFETFGPAISGLIAMGVLFGPISFISEFLVKFRQRWFPAGVFLLGQQRDADSELDQWRRFLRGKLWAGFWVVISGLVILVYNLWSKN